MVVDPEARVEDVIGYANSLYFAGYQVACRVQSKDQKRERERANSRSRECELLESKESDVFQELRRGGF